jgi:hypothetical protein
MRMKPVSQDGRLVVVKFVSRYGDVRSDSSLLQPSCTTVLLEVNKPSFYLMTFPIPLVPT